MESSALAAYGAVSALQNRTRENSDGHPVFICSKCRLLTSSCDAIEYYWCARCDTDEHVLRIIVPYALLVLSYELACTGLSLRLKVAKDRECDLSNIHASYDAFDDMQFTR